MENNSTSKYSAAVKKWKCTIEGWFYIIYVGNQVTRTGLRNPVEYAQRSIPEASEFATLVGSVKDPYHLMRIQIQDIKNKILRMRPEFNSDPGPEK